MSIFDIISNSLKLIFTFDPDLYNIISLSLKVTLSALFISSIIGLILGYLLAIYNFFFKNIIIVIFNALMGLPPVVVGLIVYFLLANNGPLGILNILYTPYAMVIAQTIIILPIVSSLSYEIFSENWKRYKDHLRSLNIPFIAVSIIIFKHSSFILITIILSAFGRAISEVGAVMIVGGNIEHYTRVMTTAITLQTRMGNLEYAMALGLILILITLFINTFVFILKVNKL